MYREVDNDLDQDGTQKPVPLLIGRDEFLNYHSRLLLDGRLWLSCRLALVRCLLEEVKGMGEIKGNNPFSIYLILLYLFAQFLLVYLLTVLTSFHIKSESLNIKAYV